MIKNILIVYPDAQREFFYELEDRLERDLIDCNPICIRVSDLELAKRKVQNVKPLELIIAHIEFPLKPKSGLDYEAAFKFEKWLRNNNIVTPMVIIVPKLNNQMISRGSHQSTHIFENDRSLSEAIVSLVKQNASQGKQLNIMLDLSTSSSTSEWRYKIKGKNIPKLKPQDGLLKKPSQTSMETIMMFTTDIDNPQITNQEERIKVLSKSLREILIEDNLEFAQNLKQALSQIDKLEQTRLQFIVNEEVYPVFLEAVLCPIDALNSARGDYWMEYSPLVRHVSAKRSGHTLFQEEEISPINILIIGSNTSGAVELDNSMKRISLDSLDNVASECDVLKNQLVKLKAEHLFNLGEIKIIQEQYDEISLTEEVKRTLCGKSWDIVHYAGHSHFDEVSRRAYIFLKDHEDYVEAVEISKFAEWLRKTRLLILSSCTSSHQSFVFELAKHQVPAVLGFRSRIKDDLASQFASSFYNSLFEIKSVDGAFYQARKSLYDKDKTDHAWTNPILVFEGMEA